MANVNLQGSAIRIKFKDQIDIQFPKNIRAISNSRVSNDLSELNHYFSWD